MLRTLDNKTDDVAEELDDLPKKDEPQEVIEALNNMLQQLNTFKEDALVAMREVNRKKASINSRLLRQILPFPS